MPPPGFPVGRLCLAAGLTVPVPAKPAEPVRRLSLRYIDLVRIV